jgi:hypothetical protein
MIMGVKRKTSLPIHKGKDSPKDIAFRTSILPCWTAPQLRQAILAWLQQCHIHRVSSERPMSFRRIRASDIRAQSILLTPWSDGNDRIGLSNKGPNLVLTGPIDLEEQ